MAVSTAAPALNHMVVDTVETAQRCVELLRAKNLGKATFICLDKLAYLQAAASAPIGVAPPEPVCVWTMVDLTETVGPMEQSAMLAFDAFIAT